MASFRSTNISAPTFQTSLSAINNIDEINNKYKMRKRQELEDSLMNQRRLEDKAFETNRDTIANTRDVDLQKMQDSFNLDKNNANIVANYELSQSKMKSDKANTEMQIKANADLENLRHRNNKDLKYTLTPAQIDTKNMMKKALEVSSVKTTGEQSAMNNVTKTVNGLTEKGINVTPALAKQLEASISAGSKNIKNQRKMIDLKKLSQMFPNADSTALEFAHKLNLETKDRGVASKKGAIELDILGSDLNTKITKQDKDRSALKGKNLSKLESKFNPLMSKLEASGDEDAYSKFMKFLPLVSDKFPNKSHNEIYSMFMKTYANEKSGMLDIWDTDLEDAMDLFAKENNINASF